MVGRGRRGGFITKLHNVHGQEWRLFLHDLLGVADKEEQNQKQHGAVQRKRTQNPGARLNKAAVARLKLRRGLPYFARYRLKHACAISLPRKIRSSATGSKAQLTRP
jgi:hypothetical protein